MTMDRNQLEDLMRTRWHEQTELIATAGLLFQRIRDGKPVDTATLDAWLARMVRHSNNLDVDLTILR